jgi:uncharacterized protein YjbI with pentapeptide repeats
MNNYPNKGLSNSQIIIAIIIIFILILSAAYGTQYLIDKNIKVSSEKLSDKKTEYEISKLDAEISQIRSETAGSLFWLKLIALFVTVGGAIGGYLIGQSRSTQAKLNFEDRKNVDEVYQSVVQELADESPILRAAAAVKLGSILKSFPSEWHVSEKRKEQLCQLTKHVLSAAISIETDKKVLKTISINLVLHKPEKDKELANMENIDLSGAKAVDAYWAKCNFEYADFYAADLSNASFRKSNLAGAQFRQTNLSNAVLDETICVNTNFKMADLRGASFNKASLTSVNFEDAKVHSVCLKDSQINDLKDCKVDISKNGDGSQFISVFDWIESSKK